MVCVGGRRTSGRCFRWKMGTRDVRKELVRGAGTVAPLRGGGRGCRKCWTMRRGRVVVGRKLVEENKGWSDCGAR